jgi:hypothetical protein
MLNDANLWRITAKFMFWMLTEGNPQKFAAVKTWVFSSILLTRMIWPLVISPCLKEQKRS